MKFFNTLTLYLGTLAIFAVTCGAAPEAETLLEPYRKAVREAIDPWENEKEPGELLASVAKIAEEHVVGLKDQLHQLALGALEGLELREYDLSEYDERFQAGADVTDATSALLGNTSTGMLIYELWNPVQAAQRFRNIALSRQLGVAAMGLHGLRDRFAPPNIYAVSKDPQRPLIAIESGDELSLVKLEYDKLGFYKTTSVRVATKKR
ncbi:MAG: hypothetical protein ACR2RV_02315 [Verrucomicrobiales bacterium]